MVDIPDGYEAYYADKLWALLPAIYRAEDPTSTDGRGPLREIVNRIGAQGAVLRRSIDRLWEDQSIETCDDWVIAYLAELLATNLVASLDARGQRIDVAKTIYYRRRKGTLPMLEELARDVTGWPAHAVEFFELLGWTQDLEHYRPQACWFDVRSHERDERVDGAFDEASHTVDVAPISTFDGWHSIKNVGFFLWRLVPNRLLVDAGATSNPWGFTFSPLGNPAPLFTHPRREDVETGLSTELNVPGPIRRSFFGKNLTSLYGLPADWLRTYVQRVEALTPAEVTRVTRKYLDPARMTLVVVGDRKVVGDSLKQFGPVKLEPPM